MSEAGSALTPDNPGSSDVPSGAALPQPLGTVEPETQATAAEPVEGPALMEPVEASERIHVVDILRGFAILGIFIVNMPVFFAPMTLPVLNPEYWTSADRAVFRGIEILAQGKFYTIFSFLFGFGFAVQMARAEARGGRFARFFSRRLLVLIGIGLVHAFLIWFGDILVTYAVYGFVLLLFRRRTQRTVRMWILGFMVLPVLLYVGAAIAIHFAPGDLVSKQTETAKKAMEDSLEVYRAGTFQQIMVRRAKDVLTVWAQVTMFGWHVVAMFLVGLYVFRRGYLHNPSEHVLLFRKLLMFGLPVGLVFTTIGSVVFHRVNPMIPSPPGIIGMAGSLIGNTLMCFAYMSAVVLIAQRDDWRRRLTPIAYVGRMALSNYLFQSVVATMIFYSYGLGLYGRVGPAMGLLLTFAIYSIQVPLSIWWLRRFRFGPMEWVWRSLTYGKAQPMRLRPEPLPV